MSGETNERALSFGEKAVGITFNPGGDQNVNEIKALYAKIIDKLNELRGEDRNERARLLSIGITQAQQAQMWAVKGITWTEV